jgi:hypothetical protein
VVPTSDAVPVVPVVPVMPAVLAPLQISLVEVTSLASSVPLPFLSIPLVMMTPPLGHIASLAEALTDVSDGFPPPPQAASQARGATQTRRNTDRIGKAPVEWMWTGRRSARRFYANCQSFGKSDDGPRLSRANAP